MYYSLAAMGQAFLFMLAACLVFYLPFIFKKWLRFTGTCLFVLCIFLLNIAAYFNGIVFQLYKFHINGFVLDLAFGSGASQVFVFNQALVVRGALIVLALLACTLACVYISFRLSRRIGVRSAMIGVYVFLLACIVPQLVHVYAAAVNNSAVQEVSDCLPQYYPLTANKLMLKLGVIRKEDLGTKNPDKVCGSDLVYPLQPIVQEDSIPSLNVIFIVLDSWNYRTFTREVCPNILDFSDRASVFRHHLSSSNGTRGGIFGLFFGISATYWSHFDRTGIQPLLIETMLKHDYDIQAFPSATLVNPPFYRVVFGSIPDIRTETPGETPFDRDNQLTTDFLEYLDRREEGSRPFFSFLFYDLMHAIDIPAPHRQKFQPSCEYANYLALNNDTDPVPFYNLYLNCAYHVDSLVGQVVRKIDEKGLTRNSVIVITGDHGQEFNENKKNFWGHSSNFSNVQVHVPLIYYYPGDAPASYSHRTSHYDIAPTLLGRIFGTQNPPEEYSMGQDLFDTVRPAYHLAGHTQNYAFILDNIIYEKKVAGNIIVTDSVLNRLPNHHVNTKLLLEAIEYKNRFLKK